MDVVVQTFKVKISYILNLEIKQPPSSVIGNNYPSFYTGIFVLPLHANT